MSGNKKTSTAPITAEWLNQVKERLQSLPPLPQTIFTRQEAITELAPYIDDAKKNRRYRIEDLLPYVNVGGQEFTVAALKTGLARAKETRPANASPALLPAPQSQAAEPSGTAVRSQARNATASKGKSAKSGPMTIEGQAVADAVTPVDDEATSVRVPSRLHPPTPDDALS